MAATKKDAIAVLPQPYVTAAQKKDSSLRIVLDLTKEWNKVCDTQLITGVTVVRTAYAEEHPEEVINFLKDYQKSVDAANDDLDGTAALCEEVGVVAKAAIAKKALPKCNIVYRIGDEMKADVNAYLQVLYDASPAADFHRRGGAFCHRPAPPDPPPSFRSSAQTGCAARAAPDRTNRRSCWDS